MTTSFSSSRGGPLIQLWLGSDHMHNSQRSHNIPSISGIMQCAFETQDTRSRSSGGATSKGPDGVQITARMAIQLLDQVVCQLASPTYPHTVDYYALPRGSSIHPETQQQNSNLDPNRVLDAKKERKYTRVAEVSLGSRWGTKNGFMEEEIGFKRSPNAVFWSESITLIRVSIAGTNLQVMADFGYPVQVWDSTVRDTVSTMSNSLSRWRIKSTKRIHKHHGRGFDGPAADCKKCIYEKE
ncbi:hypothetical protein EV363DRAFT_1296712 [Boletus edulis]|nr:hypothetical protein EV363DRAFT_1296712 [Boletus edulis]